MKKHIRYAGLLPLWALRDRYRCVHCGEYISKNDRFCRGCGDEIDVKEHITMQLKMIELAVRNRTALIFLAALIVFVVLQMIIQA